MAGSARIKSPPKLTRCGKCCYYCRIVTTFLFSHIGLCALLLGYALIGAGIFGALEAQNEIDQRHKMNNTQRELMENLWKLTTESDFLKQSEWSVKALMELETFEKKLIESVRKKGYDGNDDASDQVIQWSFSGSLLYSIIVITTIGYGNVAPRTVNGKLVTIIYAIFGIPLMLFCLSNIGDAMAHSFKFIYWKCCCFLCLKPKKRHRKRSGRRHRLQKIPIRRRRLKATEQIEMQPINNSITSSIIRSSPAAGSYGTYPYRNRQSIKQWNRYSDNMSSGILEVIANRYAQTDDITNDMSLLSPSLPSECNNRDIIKYINRSDTSGFPGPPPTPISASPSLPSFLSFALPPKPPVRFSGSDSARELITDNSMTLLPPPPVSIGTQSLLSSVSRPSLQKKKSEESDGYSTEETDDSDADSDQEKNIPILVCLTLVISYVCGGALLFKFWENWTFLDASYFCFVTLSTIGFGDLVPGKAVLSYDNGQVTLTICALYLLFGMALLAMSLNLVKEKVTKSVRSIGKRIGILVSDDDDDY